jgi:hypothetical protein
MNGKGSKPRNCFSKRFKTNYDEISWGKPAHHEQTNKHHRTQRERTSKVPSTKNG